LAKTNLDADVAKAFTQVKAASERAAALTRQLLAFGRQQILQCQPVNVGAAVARIKGLLSRTLGENIQLECQVAPNVPCVNADESNIDQIIMNLAVNARDAMPEGGKLAFSVEAVNVQANQVGVHPEKREGQFVRLTVKDTGCGMDQKTLNRIFEPFFTTKPIGRGTGLGLSTVYGIVKQNEGWIEVESQPAAGSTFRVFLPSILSSQGSSTPDLIREPVPSIPPEARPDDVIFVVEDEPEVRNFITSILSDAGYHVVEAATGADAILKWKDYGRNVRLLLTDMVMPGGISGVALARHLLRDKPALQVIYTSGYSPDVEANGDALKEGQNYLSKPFTQTSLLATVRNALHLKSSSPALKPVDSRV